MPEANVLYAVTALVVAGLVAWVAFVLKTAKEPWARELPRELTEKAAESTRDEALPPSSSLPKVLSGSAKEGADATAEATAVVVATKTSDDKKAGDGDADEKNAADEKKATGEKKAADENADEKNAADEKKATGEKKAADEKASNDAKIADEKNG